MFLRASRRKFIISRKQIFPSKKERSKSSVGVMGNCHGESEVKVIDSAQRSEEIVLAERNLENDSRNELQTLQKWGNNKLVSDKEYDIKIYNEKNKARHGTGEEMDINRSRSKIINKLSGSSIIIVYENGIQNKNMNSEMTICEDMESGKNVVLSNHFVNHRRCSGDVSRSMIDVSRSSSCTKDCDDEIKPSSLHSPEMDGKKIIIQCRGSKRNKKMEPEETVGEKEKNRMKLIPPEVLSEPKCVKIVKKAVNNETDLVQDLSNVMTGGRLIKTLKSFLGDHNKDAARTSYVEIVQKVDDTNKKHKILIFKRQIEKCKKCKDEETFNKTPENVPENNIIRLTVKKAKKNESVKQAGDSIDETKRDQNLAYKQPYVNSNVTMDNSSSYKSGDSKHMSVLRNSMSPNSNINVLLASTLNELAGTLNGRNNLKSICDSKENISKTSDSSDSRSFQSVIDKNSCSNREDTQKIGNNQTQIVSNETTTDSLSNKSVDTADKKKARHSHSNGIDVICPPKNFNKKIENENSFSQNSDATKSELSGKFEDPVQSDEICLVNPDDSKINCSGNDGKATEPTLVVNILKRDIDKSESETINTCTNSSNNTLISSEMLAENEVESVPSNFEPIVPNYVKIPSLETDTTFMQLFENRNLPNMGKNDFLVDSGSMKADYYILKKSYAAPPTLNRLASVDSLKQAEIRRTEQSRMSSQSDLKEFEGNISVTDSEDTIMERIHFNKKLDWQNKHEEPFMKDRQNFMKFDFMNFDMNQQIDSLISQDRGPVHKITHKSKEKPGLLSDAKKKKKKSALRQMKEACKIMKTSHHSHRCKK